MVAQVCHRIYVNQCVLSLYRQVTFFLGNNEIAESVL